MPLPAAQQAAKITKAAAAKAAKAAKPVEEVAPKAALTALTPVGESDNWNKGKANHMRIGSLFLAHVHETDAVLSEKCGLVWEEVPEEQAASFHVFAMLASYLVTTYSTKDASAAHTAFCIPVEEVGRGVLELLAPRCEAPLRHLLFPRNPGEHACP